jgi:uncharacterized membrane protein
MSAETLIWQPFFPWPILLALGLLAAGLALFAYFHSFRTAPVAAFFLLGGRLVLLGTIIVIMWGPSRQPTPRKSQGTGDLVVLLDASASMRADDMDGLPRYDFAVRHWLSEARLGEWGKRRVVRLHHVGDQDRAVSVEQARRPAAIAAVDNQSLLARNVRWAIDGIQEKRAGSAVLFLSDGHDSEEESFAETALRARERGIPVYTACLGGPRLERDLHLVALARQEFLFAGEEGRMSARIFQSNAGRDQTTLRVLLNGVARSIPIAFEGRSLVTVDLPVKHDKPGVYEYRFSVDPVADEVELRNNEQALFVQVVDRRIRVLLVEGEPYWETKFLAEALRRDDRIALIQVSQLSKARIETLTSREKIGKGQLPQTPGELDAYDVVVLGSHVERVLSAEVLAYLPGYVDRRGGAVLFARGYATDGERRNALALIEPVVRPSKGGAPVADKWIENEKWKPTASGGLHPIFHIEREIHRALKELPPFPRTAVTRAKAGAQVLAVIQGGATQAEGVPALVSMGIGNGKSLMVLSEGIWTWRLLSSQGSDWRYLYDRFWSNCVRWLALGGDFVPGEQIALHLSHQSAGLGETVMIDAFARYVETSRVKLSLTVRDPEGRSCELGLEPVEGNRLHQRATFRPAMPGVHTVTLNAPGLDPKRREKGLNVFALDQERLQSAAVPEALRLLAEESGGRFLDARHPENFYKELDRAEEAAIVPTRAEYVWNVRGFLLLLLTWVGLEWIIRRNRGFL